VFHATHGGSNVEDHVAKNAGLPGEPESIVAGILSVNRELGPTANSSKLPEENCVRHATVQFARMLLLPRVDFDNAAWPTLIFRFGPPCTLFDRLSAPARQASKEKRSLCGQPHSRPASRNVEPWASQRFPNGSSLSEAGAASHLRQLRNPQPSCLKRMACGPSPYSSAVHAEQRIVPEPG